MEKGKTREFTEEIDHLLHDQKLSNVFDNYFYLCVKILVFQSYLLKSTRFYR